MSASLQAILPQAARPAPPLTGFRLTRLADIPRIGIVAAASFYHSPVFQYQHPGHERFPIDTVASYRTEFTSAILDPTSVVVVRESQYNAEESSHVYQALSEIYPELGEAILPNKSGCIIVAVASFVFKPGSPRKGQFQPDENSQPHIHDPQDRKRDQSAEGNRLYAEAMAASKQRWLKDCTKVGMTATHPAYWRKGHSGVMTLWFLHVADMDQESVGVNAVGLGVKFFSSYGFRCMEEVEVKGYGSHPEDIKT